MQYGLDLDVEVDFGLQSEALVGAGAKGMLPGDEKYHWRQHGIDAIVKIFNGEFTLLYATAQDAANQVLARYQHLPLVKGSQLRKIFGLAHNQLGQAGARSVTHALPPLEHGIAQQFRGAAAIGFKFGIPQGETASQVFPDDGLEQLFLAREIKEQGAFGDPGASGDFLHPGSGESFFSEQIERRSQQFPRAGLFATAAPGQRAAVLGCGFLKYGHLMTDWSVDYRSFQAPFWRAVEGSCLQKTPPWLEKA